VWCKKLIFTENDALACFCTPDEDWEDANGIDFFEGMTIRFFHLN
jgi:hypothetical protein